MCDPDSSGSGGGIRHHASFLRDPLIEAAHGFARADDRLEDLADKLLHPDLVAALDGGDCGDFEERDRYRFKRSWHPFSHQLESWKHLLGSEPKSIMVTSGTGSGKTECFLVPLLNSLVEQAVAGRTLTGVQAIMLYPLNALINSQRERLTDWTAPFKGTIRFALFNGETKNESSADERRRKPEQVIDRTTLRANPPPILVTNITMLEYMLVRFEDRPILRQSRGKLRYIILDEAHTYVGSQAAELSLLLRRVLYAFGVTPPDVRFVATSATIGRQGDPTTRDGLRKFLSQVAGVDEAQVVVIEGYHRMPDLPPPQVGRQLPSLNELGALDTAFLFDRLGSTPVFVNGLKTLANGPVPFQRWCQAIGVQDGNVGEAVLSAASRAEKNGERLLPIRLHAFHRSQGGAWACLNPDCSGLKGTRLDDPSWSFGAVFVERTDRCPHCASPVLELKFCGRCRDISLAAQRVPHRDGAERLTGVPLDEAEDEFLSDLMEPVETSANDDEEGDGQGGGQVFAQASSEVLVASAFAVNGTIQNVNCRSGQLQDQKDADTTELRIQGPQSCPHCGATFSKHAERLYSVRIGGPFLLGSIVPELLDDAAEAPTPRKKGASDIRLRPAGGRQVLMFTDSRQGSARLAAKLQRDSEQNYIRAFIYHTLQATRGADDPQQRSDLGAKVAQLSQLIRENPELGATLAPMLEDYERRLAAMDHPQPVAWERMVGNVSNDDRVDRFIRQQVWEEREFEFRHRNRFAEFALLREFMRQPFRANSAETIGLATLRFKPFDDLDERKIPEAFREHGGTLSDWRDFLYVCMTRFARQNWAVQVDYHILHWISHKVATKTIKAPGSSAQGDREVFWPTQSKANDRRQMVRLLAQGLGLSLENRTDRDDIDECLLRAWHQFMTVCQPIEGGYRLDFNKASLALAKEAYICPVVTGLLRDHVFRGLSPYPPTPNSPFLQALKVDLPVLPFPFGQDKGVPVEPTRVQTWLAEDPAVQKLRSVGVWSDLHDRIAQYSVYFRAAEHSAQQPAARLREYEREFKAGRINLLSCSTTMEMGVDIGSISTIVMTNVPPSVASYRQRVGRAGRRGQAMALSLTLCRDKPLDRSVFRDPESFVGRTIYAPAVALESAVIAQRHVNAALLGRFLAVHEAELHKLPVGPFFGFDRDGKTMPAGQSLAEKLIVWLDSQTMREDGDVVKELFQVLAGTALDGAMAQVIDDTRGSIERARDEFAREWEAIRYDMESAQDGKAKHTALERQMRRLTGEFLLGDLAGRGFLPGYGFPTDVVNFDNELFVEGATTGKAGNGGTFASDGADRRYRLRDAPSRQLDLAIRDYAPGNDVVIDGRVYRSAGLRLDWKRPVTEESSRNIQALGSAWRCGYCGATGTSHDEPDLCPTCGRSENLTSYRFLKPAGFACDPWVMPHDKVEEITFIRPKIPWVAAQGGEWIPLTAKGAGRYRSSRSGIVFHHTLGAEGHGYAICLACGRAEPESAPIREGPPLPKGMAVHKPLRRSKAQKTVRCVGVDASSPFTIQRHRALGYEVTTDVLELQLPDVQSGTVALPLAAALRDALARKLGVEEVEMGMGATQTRDEAGLGRWSVMLYDKAPGGAGFSVAGAPHIEELLKDAAEILDCPNGEACRRGCAECVMSRDLEGYEDRVDRLGALSLIRQLVRRLGLPPGSAIFGDETRAETQPLADALMREMESRTDAELVLWLLGKPEDWDLSRWIALRIAQRLAARERRVRILIDKDTLSSLDQAARIELYGLAIKAGCILEGSTALPPVKDHQVVAWVGSDNHGQAWATRGATAQVANDNWGDSGRELLVRGFFKPIFLTEPIDPSRFLIGPERTIVVSITNHLNGSGDKFGDLFWQLACRNSAPLGGRLKAKVPLQLIEYTDRYLNSPLPIRLAKEVLARAPGLAPSTSLKIRTCDQGSRARRFVPNQLQHDWQIEGHRNLVLRDTFAADFGQRFDLDLLPKAQVSHGRVLRLVYPNGIIEIILDQGFGYWRTTRPVRFDFASSPSRQVTELLRSSFQVEAAQNYGTWVCISEGR